MSVPHHCPKTALELKKEQYDEIIGNEDPIELNTLLNIPYPVIIGNNYKTVYNLDTLLDHITKDGSARGPKGFRAANPLDPSHYVKIANLQGVHYNFDGHNNIDAYNEIERRLTQLTGIPKEKRYEEIDRFGYKPNEHDKVLKPSKIYPFVKDFVQNFISSRNIREMIYNTILYEYLREYGRKINRTERSNEDALDLSKQSDTILKKSFETFILENPEKIEFHTEGGQMYYIVNNINMVKLIVAFCYSITSTKTYTEEEFLVNFKDFLNRHNVEFKDLKDNDIIRYLNIAVTDPIGSQHLAIEKCESGFLTTRSGAVRVDNRNLYHIGRDSVSILYIFIIKYLF